MDSTKTITMEHLIGPMYYKVIALEVEIKFWNGMNVIVFILD